MKKIADIFLNMLLIFGITFLILSFFDKEDTESKSGLDIAFTATSYTIPDAPSVVVENYTDAPVTIDTCKDIALRHKGELLAIEESFCETLEIPAQSEKLISYAVVHEQFENLGKYTLSASVGEKEYSDSVEMKSKGAIAKIFSGLIYAPIYNLVVWLIEIFNHSFGWAIIAVTLIIRVILMYPQHKMMVSQRKLQALQPKMKELQEKYKNDKQQLGVKVMELYKKENVSPFGSCGILLIQMPILLVVYHIILGIQNPANSFYLFDFIKGFDVSKIDFSFFGLDLLQAGGTQGIILALVVACIQFIQIKLSLSYNKKPETKKGVVLEKKKGEKDYSQMMPDPEMMNKILQYGMPVMVGIFTYTLFAGVGLYWGITTLFMLVQQLVVNKIIKK